MKVISVSAEQGALREQAAPGEWQQELLLVRPGVHWVPAGTLETQLAWQGARPQCGPPPLRQQQGGQLKPAGPRVPITRVEHGACRARHLAAL